MAAVAVSFVVFAADRPIMPAFADRDVAALFRDGSGNPITTALDLRVSLWDAYDVRTGDINGDGSINTSALHYGAYQTTWTITPDGNGYFIPSTFGYYRFSLESLPSFPQLSPFNSFLQLEYKAQGAANTTYLNYDFVDDPPFQNVTRILLDEHSVYYVNDAGPRTNWNTFTLDANNNAATAVTLKFGETLAKTLAYTLATGQFDLNDDLSISGGLAATGAINFTAAASFSPPQGSSDPASCAEGQLFYNTTSNAVKVCNATNIWTALNGAQRDYSAVGSPAFNTSRTPSGSRDTFVIATVTMAVENDETSTITAQVDTGSGFVTIATTGHVFDVTGIGVGGTSTVSETISFIVPANTAYKIVSSGTGANALDALQELSM